MLLTEMRKLGCTIVFADFNRIIICTGKHGLDSAMGYVQSLISTLQSKEMFKWMELKPFRVWHTLVFMDMYNFAGLAVRSTHFWSSWTCITSQASRHAYLSVIKRGYGSDSTKHTRCPRPLFAVHVLWLYHYN
jgi:hypothetical protein